MQYSSTNTAGSTDFSYFGQHALACGGAGQCTPTTTSRHVPLKTDDLVESWYAYVDTIHQSPAELWECNLPGTAGSPERKPIQTEDDWNNRLLHTPLHCDIPDELDIRKAPKTDPLWTTLPFLVEAVRDHPTVSAFRREAYHVAKAEYGCHKCADAVRDLVIQFGPTGPLLFQHNPNFSQTTRRLHDIALHIWKWAEGNPTRYLRLRLATEQRLKHNTYWGPMATDAIRCTITKLQDSLSTSTQTEKVMLEAQIQEKQCELESRSTLSERYRHYINHAHSVIPDGIRTQPRKIQMCDAALNHFPMAYNLFMKLTCDWTSRSAAAAGLQRFHDIHQGLQDVTQGMTNYGEAITLLLESLMAMEGCPFINRPLEERIAIVGLYLGKAKKGLDGNGDNGVVVFALNQANGSLANLAEKAVSPEGLRAMIEDLVDPMKRMRRDASKVVSDGQIASAERDLGNFGTECATLESLQHMYKGTDMKRVWKKPIYAPDPYHTGTGSTFGALRKETESHRQNRYAPQWEQNQVVQFDSLEGLLDAVERGNQVWINVPTAAEYVTLVHMRNVADPEMWSCRPVEGQDPLGWSFNKGSAPTYCPRQDTYVEVVGGHRLKTGAYDNIILVLKNSQAMLGWACQRPRMGSWCLSSMGSRKHSKAVEKISQSSDPATRMRPSAAGETPVIGLGFNHEHNKVTKPFTCRVKDSKGNYKCIRPTDYKGSLATYVHVVHPPTPPTQTPLPPNPSGADTYRHFLSKGKNFSSYGSTYASNHRPQSAPRGKAKATGHTYAPVNRNTHLPQCQSCKQLISSLAKFCSLCGAPQ